MLNVQVSKKLRDFTVNVDLTLPRDITVLLGPSGHGKTTVLNMIAGLTKPNSGCIEIGTSTLFNSEIQIDVPLEKREIGYVFQDYALFPHMSVFENVAYGLKASNVPAHDVIQKVMETLERFSIDHLKDSLPAHLSAGQRQRVAISRSLIAEPNIMLMDEPMGALDVQLRAHVRSELKSLLLEYNIPSLIVSHDPMDAIGLGRNIIVMEHGQVVQQGTYESLLSRPTTRFIAEFVESNAYSGTVIATDAYDDVLIRLDDGLEIVASFPESSQDVLVVIHPWDFLLSRSLPDGTARNVLKGRIMNICTQHDRVRIMINGPIRLTAEISKPSLEMLQLKVDETVFAAFKATAAKVYPRSVRKEEQNSK